MPENYPDHVDTTFSREIGQKKTELQENHFSEVQSLSPLVPIDRPRSSTQRFDGLNPTDDSLEIHQ